MHSVLQCDYIAFFEEFVPSNPDSTVPVLRPPFEPGGIPIHHRLSFPAFLIISQASFASWSFFIQFFTLRLELNYARSLVSVFQLWFCANVFIAICCTECHCMVQSSVVHLPSP